MSSDIAVNIFFSEKFQNLQRTNDEQNENISEYERQKYFLKKTKLKIPVQIQHIITYKF